MTRNEFEMMARKQNEERNAEVKSNRENSTPCEVVTMFAFGGVEYCSAHRVMGPCPFKK